MSSDDAGTNGTATRETNGGDKNTPPNAPALTSEELVDRVSLEYGRALWLGQWHSSAQFVLSENRTSQRHIETERRFILAGFITVIAGVGVVIASDLDYLIKAFASAALAGFSVFGLLLSWRDKQMLKLADLRIEDMAQEVNNYFGRGRDQLVKLGHSPPEFSKRWLWALGMLGKPTPADDEDKDPVPKRTAERNYRSEVREYPRVFDSIPKLGQLIFGVRKRDLYVYFYAMWGCTGVLLSVLALLRLLDSEA